MSRRLSDDVFRITALQGEEEERYMLLGKQASLSVEFDYVSRVKSSQGERIALYLDGYPVSSVRIRLVDTTVDELNNLLLESCEPFTSEDME